MTTKTNTDTTAFDEIVEARIKKIRETLHRKAEEYAIDGNQYHNFDVAARLLKQTPEQALRGMMAKHLVSVFDLIEATCVTPERIDAKIGDTINYLILLEGVLLRDKHLIDELCNNHV